MKFSARFGFVRCVLSFARPGSQAQRAGSPCHPSRFRFSGRVGFVRRRGPLNSRADDQNLFCRATEDLRKRLNPFSRKLACPFRDPQGKKMKGKKIEPEVEAGRSPAARGTHAAGVLFSAARRKLRSPDLLAGLSDQRNENPAGSRIQPTGRVRSSFQFQNSDWMFLPPSSCLSLAGNALIS